MNLTNYDFLEAIYCEYKSWLQFEPELMSGEPLLQAFYYNNQSYGKIDEKLKVIAKQYLRTLQSEADDFEGTMECRLEPLIKYWNHIRPIYDEYLINDGCDHRCDHEHNFMYAMYFGTLDCIAVLSYAYYKAKLRFDLSGFENLDKSWLGERLHKYGIYGKASFDKVLQHMEIFPEQYMGNGIPNIQNEAKPTVTDQPGVKDEIDQETDEVGQADSCQEPNDPAVQRAVKRERKSKDMYEQRILRVIQPLVEINIVTLNDDKRTYHFIDEDMENFVYVAKLLHDWWQSKNPTKSSAVGWEYLENYFNMTITKNKRDSIWRTMTRVKNPILPECASEILKAFRIAGYSPK